MIQPKGKIYVAGRIEDFERVRRVQALVREAGYEISYDWTQGCQSDGSVSGVKGVTGSTGALADICQKEIDGVRSADAVVLLLPAGRGAHTELGLALALEKRVVIHSTDRVILGTGAETSAFYHSPRVAAALHETDIVPILRELFPRRSVV